MTTGQITMTKTRSRHEDITQGWPALCFLMRFSVWSLASHLHQTGKQHFGWAGQAPRLCSWFPSLPTKPTWSSCLLSEWECFWRVDGGGVLASWSGMITLNFMSIHSKFHKKESELIFLLAHGIFLWLKRTLVQIYTLLSQNELCGD